MSMHFGKEEFKSDSSSHIPSFENISTQSSEFESAGMDSPQNPKVAKKPSKQKNKGFDWQKKSFSQSEESNGEDAFQSEILRRQTRKQLFRPGTHSQIPIKPIENVEKTPKQKDVGAINIITAALSKHFVFKNLDKMQIDNLLAKFFYCEVKKDQFIFHQGDDADIFFILEQGKVQVLINEQQKCTLSSGMSFGELALLYSAPRSASILTLEECGLWGIDRFTFRQTIEDMILKDIAENRKFIESTAFFNNMTMQQKEDIATILIKETFAPGEFIVHEGDNADSYYILKAGTVSVCKDGNEVRELGEGVTFGEAALLEHNNVRAMSIKAKTETTCLALGRENLINILGDRVQNIAYRNLQKWAFEKHEHLKKLTDMQQEKVFEMIKNFHGEKGQNLINKGEKVTKLVIPMDGTIVYAESQKVICEKGQSFGAEYFFFENREKIVEEDVVLDYGGVFSEISMIDFEKAIGGPLFIILQKNAKSVEKKIQFEKKSTEEHKLSEISLAKIIYIKNIGKGQFGSVYLVEDDKQNRYALKQVNKQKVLQYGLERHVISERDVLKACNSPFLLQFARTYKDEFNVYFMTEYIRGLDLFDVIREIGLLNKYASQYYIGSIILAMEYLHHRSIVYRDMKPENVMVDDKGFAKVIDMGTCKILKKSGHRTFTIIGTPTYMAPEVLSGKGYTFSADFWSIGVCLYEFICGYLPYGENTDDPYEIYSEILSKKLAFPSYAKDKKCKRFIEQLLNRTPEIRSGGSFAALKSNPWFEKFDWEKLQDKELAPPYYPNKAKLISEAEIEDKRRLQKPILKFLENLSSKNLKPLAQMSGTRRMTWEESF